MRAGDLNIRARLQRADTQTDGLGGSVNTYRDVDTVYLGSRALSGSERVAHAKLSSTVTHEVKMRYRDDIEASMRFVYGNVVLQIEACLNGEGRRDELIVLCSEVR